MQIKPKNDDLAQSPWIRAAVAKIQRGWTKAEERSRRVIQNIGPTIRIYREADFAGAAHNRERVRRFNEGQQTKEARAIGSRLLSRE